MKLLILVMCSAFILSFVLTYFFKQFALQKKILDLPNNRSSHHQPTPRGGGIVFVLIFYALCVFLWVLSDIDTKLFVALLFGIPVAVIGYCDDLYSVKSYWRFLIQVAAATAGVISLGFFPSFITLFAIVATTWFVNLYNFMDGIDGLAGSEAVFVSLVAGILLLQNGNFGIGALLFGLSAAVFGFLIWNWAPAKIFMGDVGSSFLGYCFAILMWNTSLKHILPITSWFTLLALFIGDATYTLLYRMKNGKKWTQAHREHVYQRLVQAGFKHSQVTLLAILINVFFLVPAAILMLKWHSVFDLIISGLFTVSVIWIFWFCIHKKYPILTA